MKKIACSLFILCIFSAHSETFAQGGADSILNFIQQNKSRSSVFLKKNDTVIARLNEEKVMPLASTVKMIIAIEFAKQASHHVFDENSKVALKDLERYYLSNTDGDAHPKWIKYENQKGNINADSVRLIDVARGMIMFSSNANAEFLLDILGADNVNNNLKLLGLSKHTPIYPLVSSLFIYQNPKGLDEGKIIRQIDTLNEGQYAKLAFLIHNQLKYDNSYKAKFRPQDLTITMQKEWSKRLPASTTKEYARLCSILNNRQIFDKETYAVLGNVLETIMENPANSSWLSHAGMKGGSTIFVLTKAMYATLKNGTKIELAYFFNDLSGAENNRLQPFMNDFELKVLSDENFRIKLEAIQ